MKTLDLNGNWQCKAMNKYRTLPATSKSVTRWFGATVPGTVHTDLLANKLIDDPFYRMNENDIQWIDSQQWFYRREFHVPEDLLQEDRVELVAEGLDTYASLEINGKQVGKTANMFIAHRFDVKDFLREGRNVIEILFDSPTMRSKGLERKHGALRVALEPHRVYVRKAQYSFSWDWGPKLTTSGIWKSIFLQAYSVAYLKHPFVKVLSLSKKKARVKISVELERVSARPVRLRAAINGTSHVFDKTIQVKGNRTVFRAEIPNPELWWPNGYGPQHLYRLVLSLFDGPREIHRLQVPFALRTVKLVQAKDEEGRSFIIEVNGVKIFCKGTDWIPGDSFIPRISNWKYEALLTAAKNAHMNMVRVWGGGIYEQDIFYDLCDRFGLMVWQDFMYACGEYPNTQWFQNEARREAENVVQRLRNHPAIAVWCGNNECEWLFCTENPDKSPDDMSGARIFSQILPEVCKRLDGTRPYWRSSPFGSGFPNAESNGNHHQWVVWSSWKDYREYENDHARFVTEFGFQAPANRETFEEVMLPADRFPQSAVVEHHNKQVEGPERLYRFQAAHYNVGGYFDDFIYKGQLVQAEALKTAIEHWRRRKFKTAGALFWQLNDCWPVSSWAVIDSALRPKAAYYQVKRSFAPVIVTFKRTEETVEVWVTSDRLSEWKGNISISLKTLVGKTKWKMARTVVLRPNSSRRILSLDKKLQQVGKLTDYLHAELCQLDKLVAENHFFFAEPKHLNLPEPVITVRARASSAGAVLTIRANCFVKGLRLEIAGEEVQFSDNYFNLEPRRNASIQVNTGLTPAQIRKRMRLKWLES